MKIILFTLLTITSSLATAQVPNSGIATYKQTINIHSSIPDSQAAMKAFIPEFQYMEVKVSFKNEKLRFQSKPIKDDSRSEGVSIQIGGGGSEDVVMNTNNKKITQYGTMMEIDYFLTHQSGDNDFIKVDEVKTINGFLCKKATNKAEDTVIWFHENKQQIVPGPEIPIGLGFIVKVEREQMSYELLSINAEELGDNIFEIPKHHIELTNEQFTDLQEEFMEEMQESMGGKIMHTEVIQK